MGRRRKGWALVGHCAVARMQGAGSADGGAAPGLGAAGHYHLGLAAGDQAGAQRYRIQAGAALGIHCICRAVQRQLAGQGQHARGVATSAQGIAQYHDIDRIGRQPCALQQGLQHGGCDLMRLQMLEGAADWHNGTAGIAGDQDGWCRHGGVVRLVCQHWAAPPPAIGQAWGGPSCRWPFAARARH